MAVFGLPVNIFLGTPIPTYILVLKKCRNKDDNVVFGEAGGECNFIKSGNQKKALEIRPVEMRVDTCRKRKAIGKYGYMAALQELTEKNCFLNIPTLCGHIGGER